MKKKLVILFGVMILLTACDNNVLKIKEYSLEDEYVLIEDKLTFKDKSNTINIIKLEDKVVVNYNETELVSIDKKLENVKVSKIDKYYLIDFSLSNTECNNHMAYFINTEGKIVFDLSKSEYNDNLLRDITYENGQILASYPKCGECPKDNLIIGYVHVYDIKDNELSINSLRALNCGE